jgi:hypothetical protein
MSKWETTAPSSLLVPAPPELWQSPPAVASQCWQEGCQTQRIPEVPFLQGFSVLSSLDEGHRNREYCSI